MALGATGGSFLLGKRNEADAVSTLVKKGAALSLVVETNQPPLKVNASAGKATNLNAYRVDGQLRLPRRDALPRGGLHRGRQAPGGRPCWRPPGLRRRGQEAAQRRGAADVPQPLGARLRRKHRGVDPRDPVQRHQPRGERGRPRRLCPLGERRGQRHNELPLRYAPGVRSASGVPFSIHPSAWKGRSANFASIGFSELRLEGVLGSIHSPGPLP